LTPPFFLGGFKGSTGDFSLEKKPPSETLRWQAGAPAGLGNPVETFPATTTRGGQGEVREGWVFVYLK